MKKLLLFISAIIVMSFMANAQETITYNFDDGTMMGWTSLDADGDGYGWVMGTAIAGIYLVEGGSLAGEGHNASQDMVCSGSYTNFTSQVLYPNNYLLSPDKGAYSQISFWACGQDSRYPAEHFGVAVSTESTPENFTLVQEWTLTAKSSGVKSHGRDGQTRSQGNWYEFTVDLSAYAGQDIWVAIRHFNCYDEFLLDVDDITLTFGEAPAGGVIEIDFETGEMGQYAFINDATYPWTVVPADNGSQYCIQSGNAGEHGTISAISLTMQYVVDGTISFDAACWGESNAGKGISPIWDACEFYIDDIRKFQYGALQSWDHYEYPVTAGEHTFTWSYSKDSSVNPTGDYMAVDNIKFDGVEPFTPITCVAPTAITATGGFDEAHVSWNGISESFTLEYKLTAESTWTSIPGLTESQYAFTDIAEGTYDVRVQADCEAGNWVSTTFTVWHVNSTATWYGYAAYSYGAEPWIEHFINFTMQDLGNVTTANAEQFPETWAAAYSGGYMWGITKDDYNLYKAPVDDNNHTIGEIEIVEAGFASSIIRTMTYNIVDNKMYYIDENQNLISFATSDPVGTQTAIGQMSHSFQTLAADAHGETYAIEYLTGDLYRINLTNAQATLVGATGVACAYVQDMAFDLTTGELFWAQIESASHNGVYIVNPQTADVAYLGQFGSQGVELTGMFIVYSGEGVNEIAYEDLSVYPNPAKDALYIDGIDGQIVRVYDATGRLVMEEVYNGQLNVSVLQSGIYAATTGNGIIKFVKE